MCLFRLFAFSCKHHLLYCHALPSDPLCQWELLLSRSGHVYVHKVSFAPQDCRLAESAWGLAPASVAHRWSSERSRLFRACLNIPRCFMGGIENAILSRLLAASLTTLFLVDFYASSSDARTRLLKGSGRVGLWKILIKRASVHWGSWQQPTRSMGRKQKE